MFEKEFGPANVRPVRSSERKMRVPASLRVSIGKLSGICSVESLAVQIAGLKAEGIG
jgi:hypothetical protein